VIRFFGRNCLVVLDCQWVVAKTAGNFGYMKSGFLAEITGSIEKL